MQIDPGTVIGMLEEGKSCRQIADRFDLNSATIKRYIDQHLSKHYQMMALENAKARRKSAQWHFNKAYKFFSMR